MSILLEGSENLEKFEKDTVLFKEGDLPEAFFIVVSGKVTCFKKNKDRLVPIYTAGEKEIVGEDCVLLDSDQYFYSAVAMEDVELVKIDKSDVFKFMSAQSEWIPNILKDISEKIAHTSDLLTEHRIVDEKLYGGVDFNEEIEVQINKKLYIN